MSAKPTKVEVIRKRQIAQSLAEKTGSKLKIALAIVDFVFDEITTAMIKGARVNIKDFGIFTKAQRKARTGRNPATGQPIKIPASIKPRFRASKTLKIGVTTKKYDLHADLATLKSCACGAAPKAPVAARKPLAAAAKAPVRKLEAKPLAKKAAAKKAPAKSANARKRS